MCGGSPSPPKQPTYRARDGREFDNPQEANEWDRRLELASVMGYDGPINPQPIMETQTVTLQPGDEGYEDAVGPQMQWDGRGKDRVRVSNPDYGDPFTTEQQVQVGTQSGFQDYLETEGLREDFDEYWNQGLTAGDYRRDQRLAEEEAERKAEEAEREAAIEEGRNAIQNQFGNTFGEDYFANMRESATDYYMPQLTNQYEDARENVTFDLARKGTLDSSMAGDQYGDLTSRFEQNKGEIANRAQDMVNSAKDRVSQSKNQLLQLNQSVADPRQINTQLTNSLDRIQAQAPQPSPLGQVFTDYATPALSSAAKVGGAAAKEYGPTLFGSGSGNSYNVVR